MTNRRAALPRLRTVHGLALASPALPRSRPAEGPNLRPSRPPRRQRGPAATDSAPAPVAPAAPPAAQTQEEAHKLLMRAASCWFGGVWADAMGEQDDVKKAAIETRCKDLEQRVWNADDKAHLEQLRALEQNATSDVVAAVDLATKNDTVDGPRRDALVKLTQALADAVKETMLARRAGDRVKRDLDREPDKLNADETSAVAPLRAHAKLEALLTLDAGDLTKEANALGPDLRARPRRAGARAAQAPQALRGGRHLPARLRGDDAGRAAGRDAEARAGHVAQVPERHGGGGGPPGAGDGEGARARRTRWRGPGCSRASARSSQRTPTASARPRI